MSEKIWCANSRTYRPIVECMSSCGAPEQRIVCWMKPEMKPTPKRAKRVASGA